MIVNGDVVDERVVDLDSGIVIYSGFVTASGFRSQGATLTGDNLEQVAQVRWSADPDDYDSIPSNPAPIMSGDLSVIVTAGGTQMTLPAITALPSFEGCLNLLFMDHRGMPLKCFVFGL
jgi:hypothetical protein